MVFKNRSYWLKNAHVPSCLINLDDYRQQTREGLSLVDLKISNGEIEQVLAANTIEEKIPSLDLQNKIVLPCFIDVHTHLDKGHIWERSPNINGTFDMALNKAIADAEKYWQPEDVYRRMDFGLKCSYAHGTQAIRTHIDSYGEQAKISLDVFHSLQSAWQDKITLQAVSLVSLDYYQTPEGVALADKIAQIGGILGGVAFQNPDLDAQLDTVFTLANARNLDLDFHADENGDPNSICLQKIARAAIRNNFEQQITCGHCCSLAVQSPDVVSKTIELVKQAKIAIVSLPMCNLYLQDRQAAKTPYWRGVTRVRELQQHDIPVAFASDNCRDPFFGFGDHDVLEVFEQAVKIAHLDTPYANWIESVTNTPSNLMGLSNLGKILVGNQANLIIFTARYFSELLSRSQSDRIIIRNGKQIDTQLPDYSELDDLIN
ncbi:MAG: cytosine deaminase [Pleurocapsa sp. MO_192.B19]|nr:cytosine deaminase [Pleurocapsa sp. MO_192.B19]